MINFRGARQTTEAMSLRHLKRVFVSFTPGDVKAVSAREFLQRVTGDKAKKSNPACEVEFNINEDGRPGDARVDLTFNDGATMRIDSANASANQIADVIENKGKDLELRAVMKEVKFELGKS